MRNLNLVCYTVCIASIVGGVFLSLAIIWGGCDNELALKGFLSLVVFFSGAMLTLGVNGAIKVGKEKKDE